MYQKFYKSEKNEDYIQCKTKKLSLILMLLVTYNPVFKEAEDSNS